MIRKTLYATAVATFGLVLGGGAYAVSAAEGPAATARPVANIAPAADDHGGRVARDRRTEPGDDRRSSPTSTATPRSSATSAARDDRGGRVARDRRTEPGDDRRSKAGRGSGDRGGDRRGSDDRGSDG